MGANLRAVHNGENKCRVPVKCSRCYFMISLQDVINVTNTGANLNSATHTCFFSANAAKEPRRVVVLLPPALILLMITEGQATRDPCPNIRQIKTTPITGMFAGRINLE